MSSASDSPRRGLGRGLEVLIGGAGEAELLHLPIEAVHPNPRQPRRRFEPEATSGLAASIRHQGVLQPVIVRPREAGGYELVAGERRWRAAREAGMPTIPAVVRHADDRDTLLLGLVENVARENLSPVEEARAYASLIDEFELSLGEVAERVGRSKPSVSNRVRLLELPEDVLWMLARGDLTEGHARAVLALPDDDARRRLAKKIASEGLDGARCREGGPRRRRPPPRPRRDHDGRPGAGRARTHGGAAADGPPGPRQRRQARGALRRRDRPRGARRGAREHWRGRPGRVDGRWTSRARLP